MTSTRCHCEDAFTCVDSNRDKVDVMRKTGNEQIERVYTTIQHRQPDRIHKDFHGLLNYGLRYLEETYGQEALEDYLVQVANNVYGSLSQGIKKHGLKVIEKHLKKIFDLEETKYEIHNEGKRLILKVRHCPALKHMREKKYPVMKRFCECDRIITGVICKNAGIKCSIKYDQKKGECIQEFRESEM